MTTPHDSTPCAEPATTFAHLPPIEFLEYLIAEAQQALYAVCDYGTNPAHGFDTSLHIRVLVEVGPAIRHLRALNDALTPYLVHPSAARTAIVADQSLEVA